MTRITLKDVAKLAGVTPATVSMIINGKNNFKEETIERVLNAIKRLNYTPNITAKRLSLNKAETIAFFVYDIKSGFEIEILRGIEKRAIDSGYDLLFVSMVAQKYSYKEIIKNMIYSGKTDGIVSVFSEMDDELVDLIHSTRFPYIMLENRKALIDSVRVDNERGGYLAGKYLYSIGVKTPLLVSAPFSDPSMAERIEGFKTASVEFDKDFNEEDIAFVDYTDNFIDIGKKLAEKVLLYQNRDKYDGIFVPAGDEVAIGIMQALMEAGYKIPKDYKVIGFDDVPLSQLIYPSLTTIRQDLRRIGEASFELFMTRLNMKDNDKDRKEPFVPLTENIRTELIVRDST